MDDVTKQAVLCASRQAGRVLNLFSPLAGKGGRAGQGESGPVGNVLERRKGPRGTEQELLLGVLISGRKCWDFIPKTQGVSKQEC